MTYYFQVVPNAATPILLRLQKLFTSSSQLICVRHTDWAFIEVKSSIQPNQNALADITHIVMRYQPSLPTWLPPTVVAVLMNPLRVDMLVMERTIRVFQIREPYVDLVIDPSRQTDDSPAVNALASCLNEAVIIRESYIKPINQVQKWTQTLRILDKPHLAKTRIYVDFEAFINEDVAIPSEMAAIRTLNGQIVAELHCTFQPSQSQTELLELPEYAAIINKVRNLTNLDHRQVPQNSFALEQDDAVLGFVFDRFATLSSDKLEKLIPEAQQLGISISLLQKFEETNEAAAIAKGRHLELRLLRRHKSILAEQLIEFTDVHRGPIINLHKDRKFMYCPVHARCSGEHCALDDARYLNVLATGGARK